MLISFKDIKREANFLLRQKRIFVLLLITLMLTSFALYTGIIEANKQQQSITRLLQADAQEQQIVFNSKNDFGSIAYYNFHLTYLPPSQLAFAAMGNRDTHPWKHRIRMLALEGQIYESDIGHPELAATGHFDFAFVLSVLLPLILILLLHDLFANERAAGRYDLLTVTASSPLKIWATRALVLTLNLFLTLILPFIVAAVFNQVAISQIILVSLICLAQIIVWAAICYGLAKTNAPAPRLASILLSIWLITAFVIPVVGDAVIEQQITSPNGGDILMVQREAVNDAWDLPPQTTFDAFTQTHPEWKNHTNMNKMFEWKWYYAFQQVGDQQAAELAKAYREAAKQKYQAANWLSVLSPSIAVQRAMTRLANTDAITSANYQQQVRDFHAELRSFYYPLIFNQVEFDQQQIALLPQFSANSHK
ncbi:DUF3526 domain-containing protein [Catenovulum sp. SX2]|uniref:DUF3526 domain-containing protein n=1 Tax=Catenovulum sp. SX2 TaxID=3398614 RepID=UPI003F87CC81